MTDVEHVHIETFCEKLKPRVAVRTGVDVAYEPETTRLLGFHPAVWIVPALLAAALMLLERLS
jgi:hypothetical protein